jgi:hypothetical protein
MPFRLSQGKGIIKKTIKINNAKFRQSLSLRPYNIILLKT